MPSSEFHAEEGRLPEIDLPCAPPDRLIVERLGEPFPEGVEYCIAAGNPCVFFVDWDYAEDWSGAFVRVMPPDALSTAPRVDAAEFWAAVRRVHGPER